MQLADLNRMSKDQFLAQIHAPLEGESWLATRVLAKRPFVDIDGLIDAFAQVIDQASEDEQVRLIDSHPELAVAVQETLSDESIREQASAGLNQLTAEEYAEFKHLNTAYRERFGFPFVICAREHDKTSILTHFRARLQHPRAQEIATGIGEVLKIIRLRLLDMLDE